MAEGKTKTIYRIREFNRFYTVLTGLLDRKFLDSDYSAAETRILFELYDRGECSANDLVEDLHIDKGYVSRIIKGFLHKGLLSRQISGRDARSYELKLTEEGQRAARKLITASNAQIGQLLEPLNEKECCEICQAMETITKYLSMGGAEQR